MLKQTKFTSRRELKQALHRCLRLYNRHVLQSSLGYLTPVEVFKKSNSRIFFKKSVYNETKPDRHVGFREVLDNDNIEFQKTGKRNNCGVYLKIRG